MLAGVKRWLELRKNRREAEMRSLVARAAAEVRGLAVRELARVTARLQRPGRVLNYDGLRRTVRVGCRQCEWIGEVDVENFDALLSQWIRRSGGDVVLQAIDAMVLARCRCRSNGRGGGMQTLATLINGVLAESARGHDWAVLDHDGAAQRLRLHCRLCKWTEWIDRSEFIEEMISAPVVYGEWEAVAEFVRQRCNCRKDAERSGKREVIRVIRFRKEEK